MIPASLYETIYLLIVLFMTILVIPAYTSNTIRNTQRRNTDQRRIALLLTVVLILFVGLRPISGIYFSDMKAYADYYNAAYYGTYIYTLSNYIWDPLFVVIAVSGMPIEYFFVIVAAFYFVGIFVACEKIFPRDTLLAYLVYLAGFSTFSYGTNGIKAGVAASLFLIAVAYKNDFKKSLFFIILVLGVHHSMIVPIVSFIIARFVRDRNVYLLFWLFCLFLAAFHLTFIMEIFAAFTDAHGAEYLQSSKGGDVSGFRLDFILYSAIPIFLNHYLIRKFHIKSSSLDFLLNIYTLTNSVFLLCTYGTFINRIAYLSWLLYPILLLYPFLNIVWSKRQDVYLKCMVWGHLGFSLFMCFIYYV